MTTTTSETNGITSLASKKDDGLKVTTKSAAEGEEDFKGEKSIDMTPVAAENGVGGGGGGDGHTDFLCGVIEGIFISLSNSLVTLLIFQFCPRNSLS